MPSGFGILIPIEFYSLLMIFKLKRLYFFGGISFGIFKYFGSFEGAFADGIVNN
jgi:hypothetical protein